MDHCRRRDRIPEPHSLARHRTDIIPPRGFESCGHAENPRLGGVGVKPVQNESDPHPLDADAEQPPRPLQDRQQLVLHPGLPN
jgi:hypothetical protein